MTLRAVILGLLSAAFIVAAGYMNRHMGTSEMIRGHLPLSVFGLLVLATAFLNPLLSVIRKSARFRATEFAVITAMMLVACSLPSAGLMRYFTTIVVVPVHQVRSNTGWQKTDVMSYAPPQMLVNGGKFDEQAVGEWMAGMRKGTGSIALDAVPWDKWSGPLSVWPPLLLLNAMAVICLALIVHPQWSQRERLKYPIAEFATSLLEQVPGRSVGPTLLNKGFWLAFGAIVFIHLVNGINAWFPSNTIGIPLKFDFTQVFANKFSNFMATPRANILTKPEIYPAVIGFSFLLASDISFSLGITHVITTVSMYLLIRGGVELSEDYMRGGVLQWTNFGAYLGVALLIAYIGRRYYWQVLKKAVTFGSGRETEPYAVWACRFFLLATAGMVLWLTHFGLGWPLAVLAVGLSMLMFLVIARISAETGLFFYKPPWMMPAIIVGLFGLDTLGPQVLLVVGLFAMMVSADPFECLIPYVINGLRFTDGAGVRMGRMGWGMAGAFVVGLALVIPLAVWADYNYGMTGHAWVAWAAKAPFDAASRTIESLTISGKLDRVLHYDTWQRLAHIRPEGDYLWSVGTGLVLVLIVGKLRLRFTWWPLHPIIFLGFGAWVMGKFGFSFLIGWFIKSVLTKLGGQAKYRQAKPIMMGAVAGDLLGIFIFMVVNWVYYLCTGLTGIGYAMW